MTTETSTALTVTERAAVALGSSKARFELAALVKKSAAILEVKNTAGRDECHGAAMVLVKARTTIQKTGKSARDDATQFSKAVIAEEKELIAITQGEEDRLLALRNTWDEARAAERAEADRIERARVEAIDIRIADIRECAVLASQCRTAAAVWALIEKLTADKLEGFEEFRDEAVKVRESALERMSAIHAGKLSDEAEAARVKAEREAEALRMAEERAELARQRAEQEAAAAQMKADRQRMADERAVMDRLQDEINRKEQAARQAEADRIAAEEAKVVRDITPIAESDSIFSQEDGGDALEGLQVTHQDLDGPSDGAIIAVAVMAVADAFACTPDAAINRLAEIQEWMLADVAN